MIIDAPQGNEVGGLDDLAVFLSAPADEGQPPKKREPEAGAEDEDAQPDEQESEESDDPEESKDGAEEAQQQPQKIKVVVKNDAGADEELEVDQAELVKGYQRQADYTRKTQQIAEQSRQAAEIVQRQIDESRTHYQQQAQLAIAAIQRVAGIRSAEEMQALSQSDPALWVAESQRQQQIHAVLNNLNSQMMTEVQKAQQQAERAQVERIDHMRKTAWENLTKAGIDREGVKKTFEEAKKHYRFTDDELANVYDHRIVLALKDAAAYQELKSKAKTSKPLPTVSPPNSKQAAPTKEAKAQKALGERFRGGKANVNDLAAFLAANKR